MNTWPRFDRWTMHELSGLWDSAWLGEECDLASLDVVGLQYRDKLPVPGCFDCLPPYAGKRGTMVYRTQLHVTPGTTGVVRFGGLGLWAAIYVDGARLHVCDLPYSGFEVVVPPSDQVERELVVVVDNRITLERVPLFRGFYDFYGYGGIYRPVAWHEVGETWIDRVQVETLTLQPARIRATVLFGGNAPSETMLNMAMDGGAAVTQTVEVKDGRAVVELDVPNARAWSPSEPHLHVLTVKGEGDVISERFGLRTVRCEGRRILLNGEPVKLLGFCRHESHPQFGPALPLGQMIQDLELLRDMGCNVIRGSHYPQDQMFLDCCDELGFLVWEETLGWGHEPEQWAQPAFLDANLRQARAMVRNSFNHPSVIMWGFLNEGASHMAEYEPIYRQMAETLRGADATRLVTYASNRFHERQTDLLLDLVDVVSVNLYPGWYPRDRNKPRPLDEIADILHETFQLVNKLGQGNKPFLVSEIGAGAIYGWRDSHHAHWSEEYQRDYLETVCREIVGNDRYVGVTLWQFCDGRTYDSGYALGRPRAFNNKGIVDEYRRPKMAYERVKGIFRRDS